MDTVLRIRPSIGQVAFRDTAMPVADIALGGVPRGLAVVLCEAGELEEAADHIGNSFAEHGYESSTADLGAVLEGADVVSAGRDAAITEAIGALLGHAGRRGWTPDQVGVVAYGGAARAALLAAARLPVGAAVSVAMCLDAVAPPDAAAVSASSPWLGMLAAEGSAEEFVRLRAFAAQLEAASSAYTIVQTYPHVAGRFYRDSREPWEHAASFDSWQRTLEWFNLRVVPRPTPLARAWRQRHTAA